MNRFFISIYFKDGDITKRRKRDITVAFRSDDDLYERCKNLTSSQIKEIVGVRTYEELAEKARREDRSLNNYIKNRLRKKLLSKNE